MFDRARQKPVTSCHAMPKTGIIYDDIYMKHETGMHVESPKRLQSMLKKLAKAGIYPEHPDFPVLKPRKATLEQVEWVHDEMLVTDIQDTVAEAGKSGRLKHMDADTVVSKDSYEASLFAVGGNLTGIDAILDKKIDNGFALVRPPGHHTNQARARGFCLFNNIAIATEYLFREKNEKRVAIVDFDCHHGNGTQDIFYDNSTAGDLLFISTHQDGRTLYPGSGFVGDLGHGKGEGRIINIPQAPRTSDKSVKLLRDEIIGPVLHDFEPDFLLSSVGLDCHYTDPITALGWTVEGYGQFVQDLKKWADELCEGRLLLTLEGGYELKAISRACLNIMLALNGQELQEFDHLEEEPAKITEYTRDQVVNALKTSLKEYYKLA